MIDCFNSLSYDPDCRAIVLSGSGKMFSAGIDLQTLMTIGQEGADIEDTARKAYMLRKIIPDLQESFNVIEKCRKPVIALIHNGCIGGGVDMITACDVRYCTSDAFFEVKEVKMGLAADIGTLQRLPKVIGNNSLVRELVYTGRQMDAKEALQAGLVNRVYESKEEMVKGALDIASEMAQLSPVAVQTSKLSMNYSRDHGVADGLNHIVTLNSAMLQSEDVGLSATAAMTKEKAVFSKL